MKVLHRIFAFLASLSMIMVLLVTAAEAAIYIDFHFYEKEYEKYHVLNELDMKMEDVMDVTHEMMSYLHGKRDDLVVTAAVDGVEQEFFNDREKAHMVDVKNLFTAGIITRYVALGIFVVSMLALILMKGNWKKLVTKFYMAEVVVLLLLSGGLAFLFTRNFNKYFVKFHEIFFNNDLWILNPETDLMIRMLPEGFFADFAARIGIFAGVAVAVFFVISFIIYKVEKRRQEDMDLYDIS